MTTMTVYDPPMCCSTGVCGPEVDPKLAQFAGDLNWLKAQGVDVQRINLAQEPARFVENSAVKAVLDRSGVDELPAIVVDDLLVVSGRFPVRSELAALAGIETPSREFEMTAQVGELVALAAAIGANDERCSRLHYDKACELGVPVEAAHEAVRIAEAVKTASAGNIREPAEQMPAADEPDAAAGSCCGTPAKGKASSCC